MDLQLVCTDLGRTAEVKHLLGTALARRNADDGVIIEFAGDDATARTVLELVLAERRCCAEFAYEIAFAPKAERIALHVRATGDDYLAALRAIFA